MRDIKEFALAELKPLFKEWGFAAYQADVVLAWIFKRGARRFSLMNNLPVSLRKRLEEEFFISSVTVRDIRTAKDKTQKFLLELSDHNLVEAVSIPAKGRTSGCLSSQAGCKFACAFCASGSSGFRRNLTTGEILDEALELKFSSLAKSLTHIVFMGTGEPLDNYDAVLKAVRALNDSSKFGLGARRITISTCGVIPGIERLSRENLQIELSVSLHAPEDGLRSKLMPVNKKYPLQDLLSACRKYYALTRRQITFEYALIEGINSDLKNARNLVTILKGMDAKVNIIPANPVEQLGVRPPAMAEVARFRKVLLESGIPATVRQSRGEDISAACGQLKFHHENK